MSDVRRLPPFRPRCEQLEPRELPAAVAWGLTTTNTLLKFTTATPGTVEATLALTGLQPGERVLGIDFRPADGQMYALGILNAGLFDVGRLYRVNLQTGGLAVVGPGPFATDLLASPRYGWDFNPVVDRIRLVNSSGENARVNPVTGARADVPVNDGILVPLTSRVVGAAYTRSFVGTQTTTLYDIAATGSQLVLQGGVNGAPSPNTGALTPVGPLGVAVALGTDVGFDFTSDSRAFVALTDAATNRPGLYEVDRNTGQTTPVGTIGDGTAEFAGLALAPERLIATGAGAGGAPQVNLYRPEGTIKQSYLAYDEGFRGGVRVATGDVNLDGLADVITAPGRGGGPNVKAFSGATGAVLADFFAYDASFTEGVYVAAGDVNGDGFIDIVTGAGQGGSPHVKVFSGKDQTVLASFFAFEESFLGGVRVAAGDFDADGLADVVAAAGPGGGSRVRVFKGNAAATLLSFQAPPAPLRGGLYVAAGDVNGDGRADVLTSPDRSPAKLSVSDGVTVSPVVTFAVLGGAPGGATVTVGDVNGDAVQDFVVGNNRSGSGVQVLGNPDLGVVLDLAPFGSFRGGAFVG